MNASSVAVAILNYNSLPYLQQFLPALVKRTPQWASIYIIDNASSDSSETYVTTNFPSIKWIQLDENHGFAGGYNKGLQQIKEEYYVLLNSDIEVSEHWLAPLIKPLTEQNNIVACQPFILNQQEKEYFEYAGAAGGYIDLLGYPFCRGRLFNTVEKNKGQYKGQQAIGWASGACLAINASAFWQMNGFDERYFAHQEEIDLCWRLQRCGYKIVVTPHSNVYHVGGGALAYQHPKKTYLNSKNNLITCFKNWTTAELIWKLPARLMLENVAAIRELVKGHWPHSKAIYRGMFDFLAGITQWKKSFNHQEYKKVSTIYSKSIVWQYFIQKKHTYQQL